MNIINIQLYNTSSHNMSNIFKSNSRFSGLIDETTYDKNSSSFKLMKKMGWKNGNGLGKNEDGIKTPLEVEKRENNSGIGFKNDTKPFNSFKHNGHREYRHNRPLNERELQKLREEYKAEDDARKELEKQKEEKRKQESLKIENFPELVLNKKEDNFIESQNYLEKLKIINTYTDKDKDEGSDYSKPGWILIKKDKLTGKIIKKGEPTIMKESETSDEDKLMKIIDSLCDLHKRRTEEYIELNGYDNWEKMFKVQDWREWEAEYEYDSEYDSEYNSEYDDEDEYIEY